MQMQPNDHSEDQEQVLQLTLLWPGWLKRPFQPSSLGGVGILQRDGYYYQDEVSKNGNHKNEGFQYNI